MNNFNYYNPVQILFGKGKIAEISKHIPAGKKIMMTYGGGSIKKNGVYDQVMSALKGHSVIEFSGIEPNPHYETLMKAVEIIKREQVDFLLAVGGGSVIDGTKFIVAAACFEGEDKWDILAKRAHIEKALPFATVLTLPATGSEMNSGAVITKAEIEEKLDFRLSAGVPEVFGFRPRNDLFFAEASDRKWHHRYLCPCDGAIFGLSGSGHDTGPFRRRDIEDFDRIGSENLSG